MAWPREPLRWWEAACCAGYDAVHPVCYSWAVPWADSLVLSDKSLELLSAAVRHVNDAAHLLDAVRLLDGTVKRTSPDQAYYLAGYGPECARKAIFSLHWLDQSIGHDVNEASEELLDLLLSLDPLANRYDPSGFRSRFPALAGWKVDVRYAKTGFVSSTRARSFHGEAEGAVVSILALLWADGRIPKGEPAWLRSIRFFRNSSSPASRPLVSGISCASALFETSTVGCAW